MAAGPVFDPEQQLQIPENSGLLLIFRDWNQVLSATYPDISVDGYPLGKLKAKGYLSYSATPGSYRIQARGNRMTWPFVTAPISVELTANRVSYVRLNIVGNKRLVLARCQETDDLVRICERQRSEPTFEIVPEQEALAALVGLKANSDLSTQMEHENEH